MTRREAPLTSISVTMPAYNEEANIGKMIEMSMAVVSKITDDYEIVVCNDGSKDKTGDVVREKAARYPQVRLVEHPKNLGYGAAVYDGFVAATKELIFFTDGDCQFALEEIDLLLPKIAEADLVAGYRAPRRDPWLRVFYGKGWSMLVTLLFGYTARDIDCAFKLFKREIITNIGSQIESRGATFSAEFLVRAKRAGYRIVEAPVTHLPRTAGAQTGARLHVITRAFKELARFRWNLWREGKPKKYAG